MSAKFEFPTVEAKDLEVKMLLEAKDLELEEMKKRLSDQEKEKQSELLKIQMEVSRFSTYVVLLKRTSLHYLVKRRFDPSSMKTD